MIEFQKLRQKDNNITVRRIISCTDRFTYIYTVVFCYTYMIMWFYIINIIIFCYSLW